MQLILLLGTIAAGICGGFLIGTYCGKKYPIEPGEWRQYVYLGIGVVFIGLSAVLGVFLISSYVVYGY